MAATKEPAKLDWKETIDLLEKKVYEGREKQEKLNDAVATANALQEEYNKIIAEVEALKAQSQESIGNIFGSQNLRVRVF